MIKQLLLSACILFAIISHAQRQPYVQWQKFYGGINADSANCILQTNDGGFIVGGTTNSNTHDVTGNHGGNDIWIIKLSAEGVVQWQKAYGGSGDDRLGKLAKTMDGGYIVAGTSNSADKNVPVNYGLFDAWIFKLDANGAIEWSKAFGSTGSDEADNIIQTTDGGYLFTGASGTNNGNVSGNHGGKDVWIVKLNKTGVIAWQKNYGGSNNDCGYAIKQTSDSGYIVAAATASNDGNVTGFHGAPGSDYWIVKLSGDGNLQWQKTYGGNSDDVPGDILQTTNGGYVIAGYSYSTGGNISAHHLNASHQPNADMWIVKLYANGSLNWEKSLGWNNDDYAGELKQMNDGSFTIGGRTKDTGKITNNNIKPAFVLINLNSGGQINWQKTFGQGYSYGYALALTNDNGFAMAGKSMPGSKGGIGSSDYEVMKMSPFKINPTISINSEAVASCSASNVIACSIGNGGGYLVKLYRYGTLVDSTVNVTGSASFHNLLPGSYYATALNAKSFYTSREIDLLPVPSGINVTEITSTTAQLNWLHFDCTDNFLIEYRKKSTSNWQSVTTAGNVKGYVLKDLAPSTFYIVKIAAQKFKNGVLSNSGFSDSLIFVTSPANNILFTEDFEAPLIDTKTWFKEGLDTVNQIKTSSDFARKHKQSVKFSFDFKDWNGADSLQPDGKRVELHPRSSSVPGRLTMETGYWIGFSNYFPSSWQIDPAATIIFQFHGVKHPDSLGGGSFEPALHAAINGGKDFINIEVIDSNDHMFSIGSLPVVKNQWNDWIMHVKFSYTDGYDTVWVNGKMVAAYAGTNFYHVPGQKTNLGPYLKSGIYKGQWGNPKLTGQASNLTMYEDAIIIGNDAATYHQIDSSFGPRPASVVPVAMLAKVDASSVSKNNLSVYPNPVKNTLMVQFNTKQPGNYVIELTDVSGKSLQSNTFKAVEGINKITVDVSKYAHGMYAVSAINSDGEKHTVMFNKF